MLKKHGLSDSRREPAVSGFWGGWTDGQGELCAQGQVEAPRFGQHRPSMQHCPGSHLDCTTWSPKSRGVRSNYASETRRGETRIGGGRSGSRVPGSALGPAPPEFESLDEVVPLLSTARSAHSGGVLSTMTGCMTGRGGIDSHVDLMCTTASLLQAHRTTAIHKASILFRGPKPLGNGPRHAIVAFRSDSDKIP